MDTGDLVYQTGSDEKFIKMENETPNTTDLTTNTTPTSTKVKEIKNEIAHDSDIIYKHFIN